MTKNSLFRRVSSCLVSQNATSLSESFGKMSWSLLDIMTALSHYFCQTWCIYLSVKGLRSEKGIRLSIGSFSRASLAALSAASFLRIPTCPGTHIKTTSFWSASVLCSISRTCINRGWLLFSFPVLAKQTVNPRKSWIYFPETGMPAWEQIRLLAALQCNSDLLVDMRRDHLGQQMILLQQQPSHRLWNHS